MKRKDIVDLYKINFSFSSYSAGSYYVHITGGSIYIYKCASVYWSICVLCVCMYDFKSEHQQEPCHPCQTFSKFDTLLHKAHRKMLLVLQYQGSKFYVHTFSQSKKATKRVRLGGALGKLWKRGVNNIGGLHKKWG